ncbi:hypothetical protein [Oceanicoccus sp. KOV_DT_Chl]|uniref:hypothetical protein n=1 Tax=Oceanicoccus sp. KOV_DT_Chl TaxID=1904639 RepID=UPI000C7A16B1|nr:hypothetical protein [Oceanicoccus sp. KOV_DT_Chl]
MKNKAYRFLLRDNGTLRNITNHLWKQMLSSQLPFPHFSGQQITVGELGFQRQQIKHAKLWTLSIDENGFIKTLEAMPLACPALKARLDELFQQQGPEVDAMVMAFIDSLVDKTAVQTEVELADNVRQLPLLTAEMLPYNEADYIGQLLATG